MNFTCSAGDWRRCCCDRLLCRYNISISFNSLLMACFEASVCFCLFVLTMYLKIGHLSFCYFFPSRRQFVTLCLDAIAGYKVELEATTGHLQMKQRLLQEFSELQIRLERMLRNPWGTATNRWKSLATSSWFLRPSCVWVTIDQHRFTSTGRTRGRRRIL